MKDHYSRRAIARARLEHGARFPYDVTSRLWGDKAPAAKDYAHAAARGIVAELNDRGFDHLFEEAEGMPLRREIVQALATIIREAAKQEK